MPGEILILLATWFYLYQENWRQLPFVFMIWMYAIALAWLLLMIPIRRTWPSCLKLNYITILFLFQMMMSIELWFFLTNPPLSVSYSQKRAMVKIFIEKYSFLKIWSFVQNSWWMLLKSTEMMRKSRRRRKRRRRRRVASSLSSRRYFSWIG